MPAGVEYRDKILELAETVFAFAGFVLGAMPSGAPAVVGIFAALFALRLVRWGLLICNIPYRTKFVKRMIMFTVGLVIGALNIHFIGWIPGVVAWVFFIYSSLEFKKWVKKYQSENTA